MSDSELSAALWTLIDLTTLDLSDDPDYGPDPYYDDIPWAAANAAALELITIGAPAEPTAAPEHLPKPVRRGVEAILGHHWIEVVQGTIYEGGHRLHAMHRKHIHHTIGIRRDTPTDPADPPTS